MRIRGTRASVDTVRLIRVFGYGGSDALTMDEANGALPTAQLFGGSGNDRIVGGSGLQEGVPVLAPRTAVQRDPDLLRVMDGCAVHRGVAGVGVRPWEVGLHDVDERPALVSGAGVAIAEEEQPAVLRLDRSDEAAADVDELRVDHLAPSLPV